MEKRPARFWDIRGRHEEMRRQLLQEYETLQGKKKGAD